MKFKDVAEAFEALEQESSRTKMTEMLASLFKKATPSEAMIIAYLSLGSLNPPYTGTQFNFAEKSFIKVIARLLRKKIDDIKDDVRKHGDYGVLVGGGLWERSGDGDLSIAEVNKSLHKMLSFSGLGSQEAKEDFVEQLLRSLDPLSAKYIVRIILGKLRMGFSDMTLLDAFSWMVCGDKSMRDQLENAYNISADIGVLVKTLKIDGIKAVEKITITPGIPIRPAAAERMPDAESIFDKLGACVAQPKLDGFRLQVHLDKSETYAKVHFFSRNLLDMSAMFPDLKEAILALDVVDIVIEGEAIAYDVESGSFLPFQETVKRKRKHDIEKVMQDFPLKLYFFDILYLNGRSLLDETHAKRRALMIGILNDKSIERQQILLPVQEEKIKSSHDLKTYFEQNVSTGLEGVVVKRSDAPYQAGKRNFNWIKLKRDESGALDDSIDCVILGYYHGHGKRANFGIGALLVGVYNDAKDCFQTVAKLGTGMTDGEWKMQKNECDEIKVENKPSHVECAKELYPDVWVHPRIVCMVRADEITMSPLHTAGKTEKTLGFALRFPRFMGYRSDKSAGDATTVKELEKLYKMQFKKHRVVG